MVTVIGLQFGALRTLGSGAIGSWLGLRCVTMSYMKDAALTIRIDRQLERQLDRVVEQTGRSRSDIARDALRRRLAVLQFDEARRQVLPLAEAAGYLTDEDVFREEP